MAGPRRWVFWALLIVAVIMLVGTASAYLAYTRLTTNIRHTEVTREDLGESRPVKASSAARNILVVGLDQRDGDSSGERTDTIMLVHLSSKRNDVAVISFPRDLLVQLPACRAREGLPGQRRHQGMINSSFTFGGIGCTWKTIETLTGIHIDHFVKVDFNGFKAMVDAVGGVEVCIAEPIRDTYVPLNLPAGLQTLHGEQALGYVRTRHSLGDGTDIGRIRRQQNFVAAMARKTMRGGTLSDPVRLFSLLDAATRSIATDPDLTPGMMINLAFATRSLSSENIHFVITPWRYSTEYPGRVEWLQGQAKKLFQLIAADEPINRFELKEIPLTASHDSVADSSSGTTINIPASTSLASATPSLSDTCITN
nr:LCP family protein [Phyllobacterium myrsinacearum]